MGLRIITLFIAIWSIPRVGVAQNDIVFQKVPESFSDNQDGLVEYLSKITAGCFFYRSQRNQMVFCLEDGRLVGPFSEYSLTGELILDGQFCDVEFSSVSEILSDTTIRCGEWTRYVPITVRKDYGLDMDLPYQLNYYHLNGKLRRQKILDSDSLEFITDWSDKGSLEFMSIYTKNFKAPQMRIEIGNALNTSIKMDQASRFYTSSDSTGILNMKIESFNKVKSLMINKQGIIRW